MSCAAEDVLNAAKLNKFTDKPEVMPLIRAGLLAQAVSLLNPSLDMSANAVLRRAAANKYTVDLGIQTLKIIQAENLCEAAQAA